MDILIKVGKGIMVVAIVIIISELLIVSANVVGYVNRGYTVGQAIQWELDDAVYTWKSIFPYQPIERTWYPMANQNIDWNWQRNGR